MACRPLCITNELTTQTPSRVKTVEITGFSRALRKLSLTGQIRLISADFFEIFLNSLVLHLPIHPPPSRQQILMTKKLFKYKNKFYVYFYLH